MEPIFLVEIAIVAIIIVIQFYVFVKNNLAIRDLEEIYPDSRDLRVKNATISSDEGDGDIVPRSLELIDSIPKHSATFKEIVHTTNAYLTKNALLYVEMPKTIEPTVFPGWQLFKKGQSHFRHFITKLSN